MAVQIKIFDRYIPLGVTKEHGEQEQAINVFLASIPHQNVLQVEHFCVPRQHHKLGHDHVIMVVYKT